MKFIYSNISLYNYEELLENLDLRGNHTNEEIFLEAYQKWGEHTFDAISGDFAIAIFDKKCNRIIAARDSIGIKALYYTFVEENCYFSNNIDELFKISKREKIPNLQSIATLLHRGFVDYEETMYKGIKRIPPGHYLVVAGGEAKLFRYWYPEKIEIDYTISLADAALKFGNLFEKAISSRLGSEDGTALELSGGLDSSSIVSLFKTKYPSWNIDTYSMRFGALDCDESCYIKSVEEKYHFTTKYVDASKLDYLHQYDWEFSHKMSPHWPITATFSMHFPLIEIMKQDQKKIVITGQGGDHLLTGNCYVLYDLARRFAFGKILKELKHLYPSPIPFSLGCAIIPWLSQKQKIFLKKALVPFFKKENASLSRSPRDLYGLKDIASAPKRDAIAQLISPTVSTLLDSNALHILEKVFNIEFRHPFFDKKLIEFLLSLPPEYKYSRGWTKLLLRYSMENILPEEIRGRTNKAEFSEILIRQLQFADIKDKMKDSRLVSLGLITQSKLDTLIDLFENGNTQELSLLWRIVNIEFWYQKSFAKE